MSEEKEKKKGDENREYFRVDDIIPVVAYPIHIDDAKNEELLRKITSSKAFTMMDPLIQTNEDESAITTRYDKAEKDKLYDMVSEIKAKLDYIISHFILNKEGLADPEKKLVNISASGIRFTVNNAVELGDIMEIKLLLPTYPPVAVFAHGQVKRVKKIDDNKYEVAIEYVNMSESVQNEIIQYTLSHQRESIRKIKEKRANE